MVERDRTSRVGLTALAVMALVLGGCGPDTGRTGELDEPANPDIEVELAEWRVNLRPVTTPRGGTLLLAGNSGRTVHDLIVLRTEQPPGALRTRGGRADTSAPEVERVGAIEPFQPGGSRALTVDLESGRYVLICNVGGHYPAGMHAGLVVR